jgi:hypothetical protein
MMMSREKIKQEVDRLSAAQLKQVADFIAFLKFRDREVNWANDENQLAVLYTEFAEVDRELAEAGINEYAELLREEDLA